MSEKQGHDSHFVYMIIKKRAFKAALPGLGNRKTKGEVLFLIVMIVLACFGGIAAGFQTQQHVHQLRLDDRLSDLARYQISEFRTTFANRLSQPADEAASYAQWRLFPFALSRARVSHDLLDLFRRGNFDVRERFARRRIDGRDPVGRQ